MKIELLRNCAHGSEIATYLMRDEHGNKKIIKCSTSSSGIRDLRNEVLGWNWYQQERYPEDQEPRCEIVQERGMYLRVQVAFIDGRKPVYRYGLEENADVVRSVVQHYCDIWPSSSELLPMHGDLSLDNIIVNRDGIHILDWEHFAVNAAPWAFDTMYLLFETLYFGMRGRAEPTNREILIICEEINRMNTHHELHPHLLWQPLQFLREFVVTHQHLWGEQVALFPMKLPIVGFTTEQVAAIEGSIGSRMA